MAVDTPSGGAPSMYTWGSLGVGQRMLERSFSFEIIASDVRMQTFSPLHMLEVSDLYVNLGRLLPMLF